MPGNPHVRFDEGRVGRRLGARPLSYSTVSAVRLWPDCGRITAPHFRFFSNNARMRRYSSAQLAGCTKPWFSTG